MVALPDGRRIASGGSHDQVVFTTLDGRDRVTLPVPASGSTSGVIVGAEEILVTMDDGGWQLASTRLYDWALSAPRAHRSGGAPLVAVGPDARIVVAAFAALGRAGVRVAVGDVGPLLGLEGREELVDERLDNLLVDLEQVGRLLDDLLSLGAADRHLDPHVLAELVRRPSVAHVTSVVPDMPGG